MLTLLAVGHVTHDRLGQRVRAGGTAFFAARTWQALGAQARLVTAVGDDFACDGELEGLAIARSRRGATTTFVNRFDPMGHETRELEALAEVVDPSVCPASWVSCDGVLLAPVFGEVNPGVWMRAVRSSCVGISLQGMMRAKGADGRVVHRPPELSSEVLSNAAFVTLSEEDLAGLPAESILGALRRHVPVVALTQGRRGATLLVRERCLHVGTAPARVQDPTGAGDCFAAGLLFGLAGGQGVEHAVRLGVAAASVVIEGHGGATLHAMQQVWSRMPLVPVRELGHA